MKQKLVILVTITVTTLMMTSCGMHRKLTQRVIPTAVNTINSVGLSELNLKHGTDYSIMNTVTAEATILYSEQRKGEQITLREENGEFRIVYKYDSEQEAWYRIDFDGIARFGYLSNDYGTTFTNTINPEYVVRNLAIYRLINASKVRGADGLVEPVVSTNVEQRGREIVFKTTVSAKLVKLNADAK